MQIRPSKFGGSFNENDVALSDIISALSKGSMNEYLIAGHSEEYWNSDPSMVPLEIFANMASMYVVGYESRIELETMFEKLFNSYIGMVK